MMVTIVSIIFNNCINDYITDKITITINKVKSYCFFTEIYDKKWMSIDELCYLNKKCLSTNRDTDLLMVVYWMDALLVRSYYITHEKKKKLFSCVIIK